MHERSNEMPLDAPTIPRLHKADLHMLAVFMTVTECGGFAAAQVALNVGQSTISRQISDLEKRLGMRLCQRGRAGFRLTDKGRIVYEACQHLATALESFRATVGALRGELVGDLSIAAIDNWADLPPATGPARMLVHCGFPGQAGWPAERSGAGRPAWHDDRLRSRRPVSQAAMWADRVVMAPPRFDENLGFLQGVEDFPVQELGIR